MKYICEKCGIEHDASFSKRFCSMSCKMSYISSKVKHRKSGLDRKYKETSPYGTWKCRICQTIFRTKRELYNHYHLVHPSEVNRHNHIPWNRGLTSETSVSIQKRAKKIKERYERGEITPSFLGRTHKEETKKKMSESALKSKHTRICKKTMPYVTVDGKSINLDSSYERRLAKILDENHIRWERPEPLIWKDSKNNIHHYFPDFFLVDYNIYLDPKNDYCFKVQSEKIEYVKTHYKNVYFMHEDDITIEFVRAIL